MKTLEKKQARNLRVRGYSIKEICAKTGFAKASVSIWVSDIVLTPLQQKRLHARGHTLEAIEKRRQSRLVKERARRQIVIDAAFEQVKSISRDSLFLIGIALYWAEGTKKKRGVVEFSNSDPQLIKIMMRFFKEVCDVPAEKFRGHVYLHPHLNAKSAEKYWSHISAIPPKQFYKTSQQHNKASKNKKDSLPYGTFAVCICSTELRLKIQGWSEGMGKAIIK